MSDPTENAASEFAEILATLEGRRVVVVVTGSLSAAYLPYWLGFVNRLPHPPQLRVRLTRTATSMVGTAAVTALLGRPTELDSWDDAASGSTAHVELAEWADAFLVHPCTFSYLGRVANGLADTPTQLALQCTTSPVVLCPALPPGTLDAPAYKEHLERLTGRPDVTVLDPGTGVSTATGRREGLPPAPFPVGLASVATALTSKSPREATDD
ncbi:Flavoprotein [Actinopolyspora xinjiangensis]|uniref:Flavoprotein n=1 Tax=Actinopolyspora xinjiangensis TaxID=405564 RepID=A0A1H0V8H7_9ACTN|nr:flavoprotein [Actinopolyspora xinjiangensis]SDP74842.1 Flavoprotein [Actinopolyspora xinjiangensis]